MKKSNLKFIFVAIGIAIGVTAVSVYSCEKQEFTPNTTEAISDDPTRFITEPGAVCGEMIQKSVISQNNKTVANALIYNDTKYFYIIYTSAKGYYLTDAYVEMAGKMGEIPMSDAGEVLFKDFEYSITGKSPSTMRKFRIPLSELTGVSIGAAALEVTTNPDRPASRIVGWIDGKFIGENLPGRIFSYSKQACLTDNGTSNADTE